MAETVLCGIVRLDRSPDEQDLAALKSSSDVLTDVFPFVYLSGPIERDPGTGHELPLIRDRHSCGEYPLIGLHTVLKVLRQPVVTVSGHGKPPEPDLIERLVRCWDNCQERLSGVFYENASGVLERHPGLYASPLLPTLRNWDHKEKTFEELIRPEPVRIVDHVGATE